MKLGEEPLGISMYCPVLAWATGWCRSLYVQRLKPAAAASTMMITRSISRFIRFIWSAPPWRHLGIKAVTGHRTPKTLLTFRWNNEQSLLVSIKKVSQDQHRGFPIYQCRNFIGLSTLGF